MARLVSDDIVTAVSPLSFHLLKGMQAMRFRHWTCAAAGGCATYWLLVIGLFALGSPAVTAQSWPGHAHDAQHSTESGSASQVPVAIRWSTAVDLDPQYDGGILYTHYGSPMITRANTVLVPVKTGANGGFRLDARQGANGKLIWSYTSGYMLPSYNWIPPWGPTERPLDKSVILPEVGGTVIVRTFPDSASGVATQTAFFGMNNYNANPTDYNATIWICTPITSDAAGNLYFGYLSTGAALPGYPNGIPSGLARISSTGVGSFVSAASLSGNANYAKIVYNCAPAVTADGSTLYIAVNSSYASDGYLCRVSAPTLTPMVPPSVLLIDPNNGGHALIDDDGTSTPTIGPDGDVYYGVLESNLGSNHYRGWMLHFNSTLTTTKTPGAFGWDDTASIVPASAVPTYQGSSSYLILTKYNNYANGGGNGLNKVAILDPNATEIDPITGATVMNEVITILGPTKNPNGLPGVCEWCINSAAIDTFNQCAVINSEDGHVYRWSFATNTLSTGLQLAPPTGEAYTPTLVGPEGAVYAINNAVLNSCGAPH
jgi:hypothetical protein